MKNKYHYLVKVITPNKKINIFVFSIIFLGIISGAIFYASLSINDQQTVIETMQNFFQNINTNQLNNMKALKESLVINYLVIATIWIFGLTIVGTLFNVVIIYLKSFIIGFSLSTILYIYKVKGILSGIIYLLFGEFLYIVAYYLLGIYSIILSFSLLRLIFNNNSKTINILKKYLIILIIVIILILLGAIFESFVFPALIKLIIKLYI